MIAGWATGTRVGCVTKVAVGVIGALIGGALARAAGLGGIRRFGLRSIGIAAVGAILFLLLLEALARPRPGRRR